MHESLPEQANNDLKPPGAMENNSATLSSPKHSAPSGPPSPSPFPDTKPDPNPLHAKQKFNKPPHSRMFRYNRSVDAAPPIDDAP